MTDTSRVLDVSDLTITFPKAESAAVNAVSFHVDRGEVLGVAGESGSGKSSIALAALGLLPAGTTVAGSMTFEGEELVGLTGRRLRQVRGRSIAMVFQESVSALHPMRRIGDQLTRVVRAHFDLSRDEVNARVRASLSDVRLDPDRVLGRFPHELSGGMCQRVMIAMALSSGARLLLADEATTALDVSLQKEILALIRDLVETRELSSIFISHDLAVLGDVSDRTMVMYRGEVKEIAPTPSLVQRPQHPYTDALLACVPRFGGDRLTAFPEIAADDPLQVREGGCNYLGRCGRATAACHASPDINWEDGAGVRCWHPGFTSPETEAAVSR